MQIFITYVPPFSCSSEHPSQKREGCNFTWAAAQGFICSCRKATWATVWRAIIITQRKFYLLTLLLVVLKSWKISQVSFQGLDSLLPLPVLFRFLLAFLFKIINVFVSSLYLQGWLNMRLVYIISCPFFSHLYTHSLICLFSTQHQNATSPRQYFCSFS